MPMALAPELDTIRLEIDRASSEVQRLWSELNEHELTVRPTPKSWSLTQIVEHLDTTTRLCLPAVDTSIENARLKKLYSSGPFRLGLMGRLFVAYVEPPPRIRLPAPKVLVPSLAQNPDKLLDTFLASQELMKERLYRADGLDVVRARLKSPFSSLVRMDLFSYFSVFTAHQRRHLWQAGNVHRAILEMH